jgi:hypothetical protein
MEIKFGSSTRSSPFLFSGNYLPIVWKILYSIGFSNKIENIRFHLSSRSYKKLYQFILNIADRKADIVSMYALENMSEMLICNASGSIVVLKIDSFHSLSLKNNKFDQSINLDDDMGNFAVDLAIRVNTTVLLPSRYDVK